MTRHSTTIRRTASGIIAATTAGAAVLWACGPFLNDLKTVEAIRPGDDHAWARGELGVVRPRFARLYLVDAYRSMQGRTPPPGTTPSPVTLAGSSPEPANQAWDRLRATIRNPGPPPGGVGIYKSLSNYQSFENCLADAFISAIATVKDRTARYGAESPQMRDWVRAQDAVFANCSGDTPILPESPQPGADALARADRAYQTAAACFYAMQFGEAESRFRSIAEDATSPWQGYGRYLAARSAIRAATVPDTRVAGPQAFGNAEADLRRVLEEPAARPVHESARGLLDLIDSRARPVERVRVLATALAGSREVTNRQLVDFEWLMDRVLGETPSPGFLAIDRDELTRGHDLTNWLVTMQDRTAPAFERSLGEWQRRQSIPWLAAVLWKMPPRHPAMTAALGAAAAVPRDSPAVATFTFLRVRLLALSGNAPAARAVLASAPRRVTPGFPPEAINLLDAERFMLATTFDELLRTAPRMTVVWVERPRGTPQPLTPVFDDDAGVVFSERLPIARLIEAARSSRLPARLRLRIAGAAFTRAFVLRRHEQALAVVPALRALAPALAKDLAAFEAAADPDVRHRAGVLLLLRTPGMQADVKGVEDDWWFARGEAARRFEHTFRRNWWCGADSEQGGQHGTSDLVPLLYGSDRIPFPSFVTSSERATVAGERAAFAKLGPASNYLAVAAVAWARERPQDPDAAEALALAVEGTRWGCNDTLTSTLSRRAFQTLHRLYPKTEWARRTKYWYGRY